MARPRLAHPTARRDRCRGLISLSLSTALGVTGAAAGVVIELDPSDSIQAVIDDPERTDGDLIILTPGTYLQTVDFRGLAITLRSVDPADSSVVAQTIIDGGGTGSVVTCRSAEGPDTVLAGLTITGGDADSGGGMYVEGASPLVVGCRFVRNTAFFDGAGMYCLLSAPSVINCTFRGNTSIYGAGMANVLSRPLVAGCTFTGNTALASGGAMDHFNQSHAVVASCTFSGNIADAGGAMANDGSSPTLAGSVLWGNSATDGNEIYNAGGSSPVVRYCDVAGSGGSAGWDANLGEDGGGNIDADPKFVDADGPDDVAGTDDDDLHLDAGSPAIDAASNFDVPDDVADLDGDRDVTEPMPLDLDGHARFIDDPATADSGAGDAPIADMGAYELQAVVTCTGDLDGDGRVASTDLALLVAAWGPCDGCVEDLDGDGAVNFRDLLRLLFAWGPCEGDMDRPSRCHRRFGERAKSRRGIRRRH